MVLKRISLRPILYSLISLSLFWVILVAKIPTEISLQLALYTPVFFLLVATTYFLGFRLHGEYAILAGLSLTMLLFAFSVSVKWTSGYSDTGMIGGLLPYKDAKDYYIGAKRILSGLPLEHGVHSMRRPLFPGFLASLLLLTGQDLRLTLAILAQLAGISLYLSARQVRASSGALGAGLYSALMFFYIQPMIGYSVSELAGFMLGCWAFSILWLSSDRRNLLALALGFVTLMAAITARTGAFLVFPGLVIWAGWIFRGGKPFSFRAAWTAAGITVLSYLLMNTVFPRLLGVPPGSGFGSFAYAMYGQVHGGTGWHSAIDELHTTQLKVIAAATIRFFRAHPLSFMIAAAKSYRDLFLPGPQNLFAFGSSRQPEWQTYSLWASTMSLIVWGLLRSIRKLRFSLPALVVACIVGILLSIPFLPPIDAGARFYASTMPFLFVLPAIALGGFGKGIQEDPDSRRGPKKELAFASGSALILLMLAAIFPVLISRLSVPVSPIPPACVSGQNAFVIKAAPDSYIDIIPDGTNPCGLVPEVCLTAFDTNGTEKSSDDFFQELLSLARSSREGIRVMPAINLVDTRFHYFIGPSQQNSGVLANQIIAGCGTEILTKNQSIYQIMNSSASVGK